MLDQELDRAAILYNLNPDQVAKLFTGMQSSTKEFKRQIGHLQLPIELETKLANSVAQLKGGNPDELLDDYRRRESLYRELTIDSILFEMDSQFVLTADQRNLIRRLSIDRYNDTIALIVSSQEPGPPIAKFFTKQELQLILNDAQISFWVAIDGKPRLGDYLWLISEKDQRFDPLQQDRKQFQFHLKHSLPLVVESLSELKLNEQQRRKLKTLSKGTEQKLIEARTNFINQMLDQKERGIVDYDPLIQVSTPAAFAIQVSEVWDKSLRGLLDEPQLRKFQLQKSQAIRQRKRAIVGAFVIGKINQLSLTADQANALLKLLVNSASDELTYVTIDDLIIAVPDEKYRGFLNNRQWARFSKTLSAVRSMKEAK